MDFNYIDNMNSSAYLQFVADQHDHAVQTTGRKTYVFLLDKKETVLSEVYKEEIHGRVYLPHYEQRAIYKTNTFLSQLSAANYTEREEALELEYDFRRMVTNIHELKEKSSGKLMIRNSSKIPIWIDIGETFTVRDHASVLYEKQLNNTTIYKFIEEVKKETALIEIKYNGDSEEISFLEKVSCKLLPRREIELSLNNSIYRNASDVIDLGAVIVNDKFKVYQVVGAYPRNDQYNQYITWNVQCELINLGKVDGLPYDFVELIKENQYNLGKYNLG